MVEMIFPETTYQLFKTPLCNLVPRNSLPLLIGCRTYQQRQREALRTKVHSCVSQGFTSRLREQVQCASKQDGFWLYIVKTRKRICSFHVRKDLCVCAYLGYVYLGSITCFLIKQILKSFFEDICGALRDLVPFVQFQKHEKHSWRSVNFSKVAG